MEFDNMSMDPFIKQLENLVTMKFIMTMMKDKMTDEQITLLEKVFEVFSDNGVDTMTAVKILTDLGNLFKGDSK